MKSVFSGFVLIVSISVLLGAKDNQTSGGVQFVPCSDCDTNWTITVQGPKIGQDYKFSDSEGFVKDQDQPVSVAFVGNRAVVTGAENRFSRFAVIDFSFESPKLLVDLATEQAVEAPNRDRWAVLLASESRRTVADHVVQIDLKGNTVVKNVFSCEKFNEKVSNSTAVFGLSWAPKSNAFAFFESNSGKNYLVEASTEAGVAKVKRKQIVYKLTGHTKIKRWTERPYGVEIADFEEKPYFVSLEMQDRHHRDNDMR